MKSVHWMCSILLGGLVAGGMISGAQATSKPSPSVSVSPSPLALTLAAKLSPAEQKDVLKEFTRAMVSELMALDHRQKSEMRELKASQKARNKEWEQKETEAGKNKLKEKVKGPEIRAYFKDREIRHKTFQQMLKDERLEREHAHKARLQSLKEDQIARRKEVDEFLKRGERPPERLWPRPGN